jgi:hypothetical protein
MSSSSFKSTNTILVPTKGEDNCSYAAYVSSRDDFDDTFDAFSYYSSDLIRLKTLLLSDDDSSNYDDDDLSAMTAVNNALRSAGLNTLQIQSCTIKSMMLPPPSVDEAITHCPSSSSSATAAA